MKNFLTLTKIFALFFPLNISTVYAAMPITDYYYSRANGDYFEAGLWSMVSPVGSACGCYPDDDGLCSIVIPSNSAVYIGHNVVCNCNITISNNALLVVTNGGTLTVTGTSSLTGTGDLLIESGGTLNIAGDFNLNGDGTAINDGILNVYGDLTFSGNSSLCGDGILNVAGYTIGGEPCTTIVLPVELISFSARENNGSISVEWITATELNSDFFIVERSVDGIDFHELETFPAAGNSSNAILYRMEDKNPPQGIFYYRLLQKDRNGLSKTYNPIAVMNNPREKNELIVFPNPIAPGNIFSIGVHNSQKEKIKISIKDITGKEVFDQLPDPDPSGNIYNIKSSLPNPGIYFITVQFINEVISSVIVVSN